MMPLRSLLKNKLLLQKHFHLQEEAIDKWPYWMFEENISIVNEITEEEEKNRKKQEEEQQKSQQSMNFNPSSYMNQMNQVASKFN